MCCSVTLQGLAWFFAYSLNEEGHMPVAMFLNYAKNRLIIVIVKCGWIPAHLCVKTFTGELKLSMTKKETRSPSSGH